MTEPKPIAILVRRERTRDGRVRKVAEINPGPGRSGFNRLPVEVAERALREGRIDHGTWRGPVVAA